MAGITAFLILSGLAGSGALVCALQQIWLGALALHITCALLGIAACRRLAEERHQTTGTFELVLAGAIPFFGGLLAAGYALAPLLATTENVAEDFAQYIDPAERMGERLQVKSLTYFDPDPEHLAPMADILRSNATLAQKRIAIEGLARLESPEAVYILHEAIATDSVEVRFYAASVLSKLEERLGRHLELIKSDVESGRRTDPDVEAELAQSYLDYAYYGIAEGVRKDACLQQALNHAQSALERGAGIDSLLIAGRVCLEMKRFENAEKHFNKYIDAGGDSIRGLLWRTEALFHQGKYEQVRKDCQTLLAHGSLPDRIRPAIELWATANCKETA